MTYGYEDGKKGIEATYWIDGKTLFVKISGANHWHDYFQCFLAWPRLKLTWGKVHKKWFYMATELYVDILYRTVAKEYDAVHIAGHSMGGAAGTLLGMCFRRKEVTVVTINAPKVTDATGQISINNSMEVYNEYDKGDIVRHLPAFYRKTTDGYYYASTKPFWKAHNNMPAWWEGFKDPQ